MAQAPSILTSSGDVSLARDLIALSKMGITRMVLVATAVGFALAAMQRAWATPELLLTLLWCLVGTGLSSAGANALNQSVEFRRDARMRRTCERPMATGRVSVAMGTSFGLVCSIGGLAILWVGTNVAAMLVSLAIIVTYVVVYTPLKPLTIFSTHAGAIPGALPPLIGFAAAWPTSEMSVWSGLAHPAGWCIVAIVLVWQLPHFMAIAWLYREDYANAGHRILSVIDESGERTSTLALRWLALLAPVSIVPVFVDPVTFGPLYATGASLLWLVFAVAALRFRATLSEKDARTMFYASIIYLPALMIVMVLDASIRLLF
ncbi:MAG: heme o synthase [Phycisphaerales bacterium JB043]